MQDERQIITNYLLPDDFDDTLTLHQVASVFPVAYRNHPSVLELHREYEKARGSIKERIRDDIERYLTATLGELQPITKRSLNGSQDVVVVEVETSSDRSLEAPVGRLKLAELAMSEKLQEIEKDIILLSEEFQTLEKDLSAIRYPTRKPSAKSTEAKINRALQELLELVDHR